MGFVRCGIFHILMNSESLENAGMFALPCKGGEKHPGSGALFSAGKIRDLGLDFQKDVERCKQRLGRKEPGGIRSYPSNMGRTPQKGQPQQKQGRFGEAFLWGAPRTGIKCTRRGWGSWEGDTVHILGNRLDQEHGECAGERWAGLGWAGLRWGEEQSPAPAQLKGPQSILASRASLRAKGQSREASLQANYLGRNLKDIPIACEAARQVWCLFVSVFISHSVSFPAPQGTGWMQALAFSWNKN